MLYRVSTLYTLESLGGDGYDYGQSRSTAVGGYALHLAEDRGETYGGNTAVGHSAGYTGGSNINFGGNVYVGNNVGYFHDGGGSVFIGNGAGQNYMTGSNNVGIGKRWYEDLLLPLRLVMIMLL